MHQHSTCGDNSIVHGCKRTLRKNLNAVVQVYFLTDIMASDTCTCLCGGLGKSSLNWTVHQIYVFVHSFVVKSGLKRPKRKSEQPANSWKLALEPEGWQQAGSTAVLHLTADSRGQQPCKLFFCTGPELWSCIRCTFAGRGDLVRKRVN